MTVKPVLRVHRGGGVGHMTLTKLIVLSVECLYRAGQIKLSSMRV